MAPISPNRFGHGTRSPKTNDSPRSGRSSPSSNRMVVVLPAPFGPKKPKTSPSSIVRLRSSTAARPPKRLVSPCSRMASDTAGSIPRAMRIGLALPHYDYSFPGGEPLSWPGLLDAAVRAEPLGFDSAWIPDPFFPGIRRYGGPEGLLGSVEPFTALAAIAAATSRIRLGTLVACAPFRHPAHVAKMATTIDLVSGGRFDLGIGAGWYEAEFDAFGYDFATLGERFSILEESVEVIARLLRNEQVDFDGEHFHLDGAFNHPAPARPNGPPIWIGGKGGPRQFRLVARHAAGWNSVWRWAPEPFGERVQELRRVAESEGRDPASVRASAGLYAPARGGDASVAARCNA